MLGSLLVSIIARTAKYPGRWQSENTTKSHCTTSFTQDRYWEGKTRRVSASAQVRRSRELNRIQGLYRAFGGRSGTFQGGGWWDFMPRDCFFDSAGWEQRPAVRAVRVFWQLATLGGRAWPLVWLKGLTLLAFVFLMLKLQSSFLSLPSRCVCLWPMSVLWILWYATVHHSWLVLRCLSSKTLLDNTLNHNKYNIIILFPQLSIHKKELSGHSCVSQALLQLCSMSCKATKELTLLVTSFNYLFSITFYPGSLPSFLVVLGHCWPWFLCLAVHGGFRIPFAFHHALKPVSPVSLPTGLDLNLCCVLSRPQNCRVW